MFVFALFTDLLLFVALVCMIPNNLVLLAQINTWVGNFLAGLLGSILSLGWLAKFSLATGIKATANYYGFTAIYIVLKFVKDLLLRGLRPTHPKPPRAVKAKP